VCGCKLQALLKSLWIARYEPAGNQVVSQEEEMEEKSKREK
jgi:hypothetical protein